MMHCEATTRVADTTDQAQVLAAYAAWDRVRTVSPEDVIYLLELGPELVGIVRRTYEHDVILLRGMCITPERRCQGLGLMLLESFVHGLNGADCYCLPYTHLTNFYGKVGFVTVPESSIPPFLQKRLIGYRERGHSVLAMCRPSKTMDLDYAG